MTTLPNSISSGSTAPLSPPPPPPPTTTAPLPPQLPGQPPRPALGPDGAALTGGQRATGPLMGDLPDVPGGPPGGMDWLPPQPGPPGALPLGPGGLPDLSPGFVPPGAPRQAVPPALNKLSPGPVPRDQFLQSAFVQQILEQSHRNPASLAHVFEHFAGGKDHLAPADQAAFLAWAAGEQGQLVNQPQQLDWTPGQAIPPGQQVELARGLAANEPRAKAKLEGDLASTDANTRHWATRALVDAPADAYKNTSRPAFDRIVEQARGGDATAAQALQGFAQHHPDWGNEARQALDRDAAGRREHVAAGGSLAEMGRRAEQVVGEHGDAARIPPGELARTWLQGAGQGDPAAAARQLQDGMAATGPTREIAEAVFQQLLAKGGQAPGPQILGRLAGQNSALGDAVANAWAARPEQLTPEQLPVLLQRASAPGTTGDRMRSAIGRALASAEPTSPLGRELASAREAIQAGRQPTGDLGLYLAGLQGQLLSATTPAENTPAFEARALRHDAALQVLTSAPGLLPPAQIANLMEASRFFRTAGSPLTQRADAARQAAVEGVASGAAAGAFTQGGIDALKRSFTQWQEQNVLEPDQRGQVLQALAPHMYPIELGDIGRNIPGAPRGARGADPSLLAGLLAPNSHVSDAVRDRAMEYALNELQHGNVPADHPLWNAAFDSLASRGSQADMQRFTGMRYPLSSLPIPELRNGAAAEAGQHFQQQIQQADRLQFKTVPQPDGTVRREVVGTLPREGGGFTIGDTRAPNGERAVDIASRRVDGERTQVLAAGSRQGPGQDPTARLTWNRSAPGATSGQQLTLRREAGRTTEENETVSEPRPATPTDLDITGTAAHVLWNTPQDILNGLIERHGQGNMVVQTRTATTTGPDGRPQQTTQTMIGSRDGRERVVLDGNDPRSPSRITIERKNPQTDRYDSQMFYTGSNADTQVRSSRRTGTGFIETSQTGNFRDARANGQKPPNYERRLLESDAANSADVTRQLDLEASRGTQLGRMRPLLDSRQYQQFMREAAAAGRPVELQMHEETNERGERMARLVATSGTDVLTMAVEGDSPPAVQLRHDTGHGVEVSSAMALPNGSHDLEDAGLFGDSNRVVSGSSTIVDTVGRTGGRVAAGLRGSRFASLAAADIMGARLGGAMSRLGSTVAGSRAGATALGVGAMGLKALGGASAVFSLLSIKGDLAKDDYLGAALDLTAGVGTIIGMTASGSVIGPWGAAAGFVAGSVSFARNEFKAAEIAPVAPAFQGPLAPARR